jgi:hypothetical protein
MRKAKSPLVEQAGNVTSASFATQARLGEKNRLRFLAMICTSRLQNDELLVNVEGGISVEEQRRIEEVFDELCPPPCLENIDIRGYFGQRLPRWMMPWFPFIARNLQIFPIYLVYP